MAERISKIINDRHDLLVNSADALEKRIRQFPEGTVKIKRTKYVSYYYLCLGKTEIRRLTGEDNELLKVLIQKSYLKTVLKATKDEIHAIEKLKSNYPAQILEDVYDNLPDERKAYATPIVPGDEKYAQNWLAIPYTPKPFRQDAPEFYTMKGERVRSKSEVIIADRLFAKGIPYKYECPLKIGQEIIHPDFTILRMSDRKILYHEHCGKMGDHDYVENMIDRVNNYGRAGIYIGKDLFLSLESADTPIDISWLDGFIENNYR